MYASFVSVAALLAGSAVAKSCMNITVPLTLQSRNAVFGNLATPYTALVSHTAPGRPLMKLTIIC